jgi:hypothetical protein
MKKLAVLSAAVLMLSACSSLVVMQNPKTNEIVQCNSNAVGPLHRQAENEDCAKAYEKAGWVRLTSDDDK